MDSPENIILEILKKGEVAKFGQLFSEYYSPLYLLSRIYIPDAQEAKDIVQNVFLKIWDKRKTIEMKVSF